MKGPRRSVATRIATPATNPGTPDTTPPTAPGTPVVSNISGDGVTITFAESTDTVGVAGYAAFIDGGNAHAAISNGNNPSIIILGLLPGEHRVEVKAFDLAGNFSTASESVGFEVKKPGTGEVYLPPMAKIIDPLSITNISDKAWTMVEASGGESALSALHLGLGSGAGSKTIKISTPASSGLNGSATAPLSAVNMSEYDYIEISYFSEQYDAVSPTFGALYLFTSTPSTSDYYSINIQVLNPGWNICRILKSLFSITGSPSWSNINQVRFRVNSSTNTIRTLYFADLRGVVLSQQRAAISVGIDDGHKSSYQVAALAAARGIRLTYFIMPDLIGTNNYLTKSDLMDIRAMGHELAIHGPGGVYGNGNWMDELNGIGYDAFVEKLRADKDAMMELGVDIECASYPQGVFASYPVQNGFENDPLQNALKEVGIKFIRMIISTGFFGIYALYSTRFPKCSRLILGGFSLNNTTSLAQAKANIDAARDAGAWINIYGHKSASTALDSTTWAISDYIDLFDYIQAGKIAGSYVVKPFCEMARELKSRGFLTDTE